MKTIKLFVKCLALTIFALLSSCKKEENTLPTVYNNTLDKEINEKLVCLGFNPNNVQDCNDYVIAEEDMVLNKNEILTGQINIVEYSNLNDVFSKTEQNVINQNADVTINNLYIKYYIDLSLNCHFF